MRCIHTSRLPAVAPGKLSQAYQFGAQIIEVDGNFDDALRQSLHVASIGSGYTVNSVNPFRIEGQKNLEIHLKNLCDNLQAWMDLFVVQLVFR